MDPQNISMFIPNVSYTHTEEGQEALKFVMWLCISLFLNNRTIDVLLIFGDGLGGGG